jgi:predicted flap endonuclease-1-like 5' DNA nuclease
MRSDYALYAVAVILFALTITVVVLTMEMRELWAVTTAVLGLLFLGLGYMQRPRPQEMMLKTTIEPAAPISTPPPATLATPATAVTVEERAESIVETAPQVSELTKVKGIGEKRAGQLNALGIHSIGDLANASAKDLAGKLDISPKITSKWIEGAKQLAE